MVKQIQSAEEFDATIASGVVAVDFTATWCGPCKMIGPVFEKLAGEYPSITCIKVDVDDQSDVAAKVGIRAMPTFKFYKDGAEVKELVGASEEKLKALFAELA